MIKECWVEFNHRHHLIYVAIIVLANAEDLQFKNASCRATMATMANNTINIQMICPTFKYISRTLVMGFNKFEGLTDIFFAGIFKIYDHS